MKDEIKNGIIITVIVLLIIIGVYLITAVFMTGEIGNNGSNKNNVSQAISDYTEYSNMILASNTFKQKESEYMVMFILKDELKDDLESKINSYSQLDGKLKLYIVSMDDAVNKFVYNKEDNPSASNYDELKVSKNTLIIIKNGLIESYLNEKEEIIEKLSN